MSRVVLVGGGTAGHVEPALAVGRYLQKKNPNIELEFVGTKSGVEVELLIDTGIKFHSILKVPFPRKFDLAAILWPFKFKYAFFQSVGAIKEADLVIGFGGYVSAPVYLAAKFLRIPLMIHEANAKPGLANKLGAKLSKNLFIAFEGARTLGGSWKLATNIGMPIKEKIDHFGEEDQSLPRKSYLDELNLNNGNKNLLIFGGSIGAKQINKAITESVDKLLDTGWNVIHAVGGNNELPDMQGNYRPIPYIHNMAGAYAAADFIISRSGAVTCAELAATGRPALLVPLKIGNGEQEANAKELIASGQASMVSNADFTAEWVKGNLPAILNSHPTSRKGVTRQAASKIGERALELIRVSA